MFQRPSSSFGGPGTFSSGGYGLGGGLLGDAFSDPFLRNFQDLGFSDISTNRDWWDQRNLDRMDRLFDPSRPFGRFDRPTGMLTDLDYARASPVFDRNVISKTFPRHVGSTLMIDDQGRQIWRPSSDVFETDPEIIIHVDLPGVQKEDVKIDVDKDSIVVHGESRRPEGYEAASSRVRERNIGAFRKIVYLPDWVRTDDMKAHMENGLLEIKIPKAEGAHSRKQITLE